MQNNQAKIYETLTGISENGPTKFFSFRKWKVKTLSIAKNQIGTKSVWFRQVSLYMVILILVGKTPKEIVDCDMMLENAMDFRNGTVGLAYNPNYVSHK